MLMFVRFEVDSVENGSSVSDGRRLSERSVEDLAKNVNHSPTHGMTRAARALTVRWVHNTLKYTESCPTILHCLCNWTYTVYHEKTIYLFYTFPCQNNFFGPGQKNFSKCSLGQPKRWRSPVHYVSACYHELSGISRSTLNLLERSF